MDILGWGFYVVVISLFFFWGGAPRESIAFEYLRQFYPYFSLCNYSSTGQSEAKDGRILIGVKSVFAAEIILNLYLSKIKAIG